MASISMAASNVAMLHAANSAVINRLVPPAHQLTFGHSLCQCQCPSLRVSSTLRLRSRSLCHVAGNFYSLSCLHKALVYSLFQNFTFLNFKELVLNSLAPYRPHNSYGCWELGTPLLNFQDMSVFGDASLFMRMREFWDLSMTTWSDPSLVIFCVVSISVYCGEGLMLLRYIALYQSLDQSTIYFGLVVCGYGYKFTQLHFSYARGGRVDLSDEK